MITTYRSPGGAGVRIDGGTTYTGRRGLRALRLDALQADLPRTRLRGRGAEGAAGDRRVPDPRRHDQHRVPPGGARRPGLRRGQHHDVVHRDPPAPAPGPRVRRPRHQADDLPRRRDGQPAARSRRRSAWTRPPSCPACAGSRPAASPLRTAPASSCSRSGPRSSPGGSGRRRTVARHRHDLPRRPPVAARHPGPDPRPAPGGRPRRAHHPGAVVPGVLGRRDVRRGAALPLRGPVGAAGRTAPGGAQHLPADAAPRPQHGRLHAVPDRGDHGVRARGRRQRARRVPDLRRAQRRRADAPGHRGGPGDRHDRRRGRALLHRRPVQPCREALHPRLLPRPRRADRRGRRARPGDQGHGRPAARARRADPGHGAARAVRPAGAPAHPRHRRRPARHPAGRDRRRGRRRRRGDRVDGRHDLAARPVRARVRDRPLRPRDRALAGRGQRAGALLGGDPAGLRAVRVRAARARPAASTATRSPAASSPTCGSRRSRSASARSSSRSRTCTPRPTTSSATSSRSPRPPRSSATSPSPWSASAPTRRSSRRTRPGSTSPTRSSASSTASSATRRAAGPSRSAPRRWRAGPGSRRPAR